MNPKIKNLVEELQLECDKSDIALVLGMIAPNMEDGMISFNGTFALQSIVLMTMNDNFKESMRTNDCDCPVCQATKEMMFHE